MKHAVGYQAEQRRAPYLPALEAKFGARLAGPLLIREEHDEDGHRIVVSVQLVAGVDEARLATAIAEEVWLHAGRAGSTAAEVVAVVRGGDGREPLRLRVARPTPGR